jgi:hypothetical protein
MAQVDTYDYSSTLPYMEPFQNPFESEPFIPPEMESTHGTLWKFKDCVEAWTFGVSHFKKYVYLKHLEKGGPGFLVWNNNEKVTIVDSYHSDYLVITLNEMDDSGRSKSHLHSLVIKVHEHGPRFDMDDLSASMSQSTPELKQAFEKFSEWKNAKATILSRKLNQIWMSLDKHAGRQSTRTPASAIRERRPRDPESRDENRSQSGTPRGGSRASGGKRA